MPRYRSHSLAALAGVAVLGCASPGAPGVEELVRSADSAEDHWTIVEIYRREAAEARKMAAEHRRLAHVYGGRHNWGVAFTNRASDHCMELSMSEDERASYFELLATEHERLAQE